MSRDPVADDRGEFADLEIQPRIIERRVAQQVFIEASIVRFDSRIEAAIYTSLNEAVKMLAEPRIEKQRESRIDKTVVAEEQTRRAPINVIAFEIERAAEVHAGDTV